MLTPSNKNHDQKPTLVPGSGLNNRRNSNNSSGAQKSITDFFLTTKHNHSHSPRRSKRIPEQIIKSEREQKLSIAIVEGQQEGLKKKEFPGKGRGIVSTRKFCRGDFVVEYCGELLDSYAAREREKQYGRDRTIGCYMFYFTHKNHQYCVDATAESDRLGRLVNHCRNGNLTPKVVEVNGIPHLILVAKRDIHENEELTYDYGDRREKAIFFHPWLAH